VQIPETETVNKIALKLLGTLLTIKFLLC